VLKTINFFEIFILVVYTYHTVNRYGYTTLDIHDQVELHQCDNNYHMNTQKVQLRTSKQIHSAKTVVSQRSKLTLS